MAKDICIICGQETAYEFETHIDYRIGYVEGAGQLCKKCYTGDKSETYFTPKLEIRVDEETILGTPNDFELGEKIRKMFYDAKNIR